MKRLSLIVISILVISSPVAAQESSARATDSLTAATPGRAEKTSPGPPGFLVKNGKVYITMLGDSALPMPGGGDSGCLSLTLSERIEKLKEHINLLHSTLK